MAVDKCTGGTSSQIEVPAQNGNCDCIASVKFVNTGGSTVLVVTTTTGATFTSPNLKGAAGATGPQGVTGATGTTGANGVAVLYNNYANDATTGIAGYETLDSFALPANKLAADGDEIRVHGVYTTNTESPSPAQLVRLTFNGVNLIQAINTGFYAAGLTKIEIDTRLTRTSNTTAEYEVYVKFYVTGIAGQNIVNQYTQGPIQLTGLNFTTTAYTIAAQGKSVVIGDITSQALEVVYYKKQ